MDSRAAVLSTKAEIDFMRELMLGLWLNDQRLVFASQWQMDKELSAFVTLSYPQLFSHQVLL